MESRHLSVIKAELSIIKCVSMFSQVFLVIYVCIIQTYLMHPVNGCVDVKAEEKILNQYTKICSRIWTVKTKIAIISLWIEIKQILKAVQATRHTAVKVQQLKQAGRPGKRVSGSGEGGSGPSVSEQLSPVQHACKGWEKKADILPHTKALTITLKWQLSNQKKSHERYLHPVYKRR